MLRRDERFEMLVVYCAVFLILLGLEYWIQRKRARRGAVLTFEV